MGEILAKHDPSYQKVRIAIQSSFCVKYTLQFHVSYAEFWRIMRIDHSHIEYLLYPLSIFRNLYMPAGERYLCQDQGLLRHHNMSTINGATNVYMFI